MAGHEGGTWLAGHPVGQGRSAEAEEAVGQGASRLRGRLAERAVAGLSRYRPANPLLRSFTRSKRGSALPSTAVAWASRAMRNASSNFWLDMSSVRAFLSMT